MKIRAKISLIVITAVIVTTAFAACRNNDDVIVSSLTTTQPQTTTFSADVTTSNEKLTENKPEETTTVEQEATTRHNDRYDNGNKDINSENIDRMEQGDIRDGDVIEQGDYIYTYYSSVNGWSVEAVDKTQTTYSPIKENIYGIPIVSMQGCFYKCNNMVSAPEIPSTVTNMEYCFAECKSLSGTIIIPENVTNLSYCFFTSSKDIKDVIIYSKNISQATGMIDADAKIILHIYVNSQTMNTILKIIPLGYDVPIIHM